MITPGLDQVIMDWRHRCGEAGGDTIGDPRIVEPKCDAGAAAPAAITLPRLAIPAGDTDRIRDRAWAKRNATTTCPMPRETPGHAGESWPGSTASAG